MNERDIFIAALDKPTVQERSHYLTEACGADATLRQRVEELLRVHEKTGEFLQTPLADRLAQNVDLAESCDEKMCGTATPRPAGIELSFLEPSDQSGSLGRIGHYEVQEVIGAGGMGIVLRAFDERLHRVVAIKSMAAPLAVSAAARKRFLREARAVAAVSHDHIVTIHAVEESGDLPYIVMQCVAGQSLQQRIDRDGPLSLREILRIGTQTAAGLAAAHAQGLVHLDIKPANILLENGIERVKITDFGLARAAADASTSQSGVAGTPQYMAPEQARGEALDHRADLFSLGSVLYAMCTGRAPFRAATSMAVLKRVCDDIPSPIREVNPDIPEWLTALINKLQAKNPADRYQSAAEVADVLSQRLAQLQQPGVAHAVRLETAGLQSGPKASGASWFVGATVALVLLACTLAFTEAGGLTNLATTAVRIFTPDGTLVVETNDPGVKVTVEGDGGLVITGAGLEEIRLRPGSYKVRADKDGKPVPLETELVSISRGDREIVKVRVKSVAAQSRTHASSDTPPTAVAPFGEAAANDYQESWAKHLSVPVEFANSVGMKFRLIPPGEFDMGSTPQEIEAARAADKYSDDQRISDALTSEGPIHRVVLSEPFYLGVTEVTQQEFETLTGRNPSSFRAGGANADQVKDAETSQLPVQGISWNDAADFCSQLSLREGLSSNYRLVGSAVQMLPGNGYRLPREAQWEFACRAGTSTRFWFGDRAANHAKREWLRANSAGRPHPVGSLAKNPFGLFDMHGNVSEWCQDGWNPEFYLLHKDRPAVDPLSKPQGSHEHMVRGGAWNTEPVVRARSAFRIPAAPWKQFESNGLRVTLAVDSARQVIERKKRGELPVAAPPEPGAFVLIGGPGVAERKFHTLAEAVPNASDGDTIEVRGDGPFVAEPITIKRQALTIRAGEGFRPVIRLENENARTDGYLLQTDARLVLEGLEFQRIDDGKHHDPTQVSFLLLASGDVLHVANCSFRLISANDHLCSQVLLGAHSTRSCVRNCELLSPTGLAIDLSVGADERSHHLDNNVIAGRQTLMSWRCESKPTRDDVQIRLTRNTIMSEACTSLHIDSSPAANLSKNVGGGRLVPVQAVGNVFDAGWFLCIGHSLEPQDQLDAEQSLKRVIGWSDQDNLYDVEFGFSYSSDGRDLKVHGPRSLAEWKEFWAQRDASATEGPIRYEGGNVSVKLLSACEKIASNDFRLRADSAGHRAGPDGKDLGADVDLVGPGPAYERWKKTPAYQEWLRETGQLEKRAAAKPESGAFVVQGGAGVAERRFDTLAAAVQAASDGDTIEIRGNGPFVSEPIDIQRTALTIRAAEGFRPVIKLSPEASRQKGTFLATNAALVLEGLELHRAPPEDWASGEFSAVGTNEAPLWAANCRFRGQQWVNRSPVCVLRNCEFLTEKGGSAGARFRTGGKLILENCLHRATAFPIGFEFEDAAVNDASIQIKRNSFASQGASLRLVLRNLTSVSSGPSQESKAILIDITECIFDAPGALGFEQTRQFLEKSTALEPAEAEATLVRLLQWRGERNLFSAGSTSVSWSADSKPQPPHGPKNLEEWKQFWGTAEPASLPGTIRFQGGNLRSLTGSAIDQLTPDDFRLRADSAGYRAGLDGKDLGADVDLVGPGAAYERWKQTQEYQDWLKETGQMK